MPSSPVPLTKEQVVNQLVSDLFRVRPQDRPRFAREQLTKTHPGIVRAFDAIPRAQLGKSILFVAINPHSRETRLAAAARIAGWNPLLVHLDTPKYAPDQFFSFAARLDNILQIVAVCWLFPGALVHCFVLGGDHAHLLALLKQRPLVVDLYDTTSGMVFLPAQRHRDEKATIPLADGITHRDLRMKYLQKNHGYTLPRHNILIHDPLPEPRPVPPSPRTDSEIHVVSVGWVGSGDNSIMRIARALCLNRIHLHIYLNPFQNNASEGEAYRQLQAESGYLHLEQPVYGESYWAELARYDFGLSAYEPYVFGERARDYTDDYLRGCGSSRLSDYISADLGVIVTPQLRFQYFWARRFAATVVPTSRAFIENPRPALEAALRVKTARDCGMISIQGVARRLGDFYTRVTTQGRSPAARLAPDSSPSGRGKNAPRR